MILDRGFIYRIKEKEGNGCYVGSTKNINKRTLQHKLACLYKPNVSPYNYIIGKGGFSNFTIEVIEEIENIDRKDLLKKEGDYIRQFGTLNKKISGRTLQQYNIDNIDRLREHRRKVVDCNICGCKSYKKNLARHRRTKTHQKNLLG